ncbi:MAG: glycosyltransferase family 2 protein, partial [Alphaproteobacteria bacterium]
MARRRAAPSEGVGRLVQRDRSPVPDVPGEIRAVIVLRDEMLRLPRILDWHRALGVGRFLVVDNDSRDGTADFLLTQPDVHVFHTDGSFAASQCGTAWTNALLDAYCPAHWTLVVDADELFVYPDCERIGIGRLVRHLDATGAEAMFAVLVDMYAAGPIAEARLAPGATLLSACPHFDPGPYRAIASRVFPHRELIGG